jgi:hypothetical protein
MSLNNWFYHLVSSEACHFPDNAKSGQKMPLIANRNSAQNTVQKTHHGGVFTRFF